MNLKDKILFAIIEITIAIKLISSQSITELKFLLLKNKTLQPNSDNYTLINSLIDKSSIFCMKNCFQISKCNAVKIFNNTCELFNIKREISLVFDDQTKLFLKKDDRNYLDLNDKIGRRFNFLNSNSINLNEISF